MERMSQHHDDAEIESINQAEKVIDKVLSTGKDFYKHTIDTQHNDLNDYGDNRANLQT